MKFRKLPLLCCLLSLCACDLFGAGSGSNSGPAVAYQTPTGASSVSTGGLPKLDSATYTGTVNPGTALNSSGTGTALDDLVPYSGAFNAMAVGYSTAAFTLPTGLRTAGIYVPADLPTNPSVVIAFHDTGGNSTAFLDASGLRAVADTHKFLVVLPQAIANRQGSPGDVDHFDNQTYPTGWNIVDASPNSNDDIVFVRALIQAARNNFQINSDRVYAVGHSNGAFFSYFVATILNDRIAAFAENAGGAVRCDNRGSDAPGSQFVGDKETCADLQKLPGYPTCTGEIKPIAPNTSTRQPPGYLAHHNDDTSISVAWSCTLFNAATNRSAIAILSPNGDSKGHTLTRQFAEVAWAFMSRYTRND